MIKTGILRPFILLMILIFTFGFTADNPKKKVLFLGDSLTQAGAEPGGYIELMKEELKNRGLYRKYELIGKGVGGNKMRDLLARVENDVIQQKPDLVFIMIGINDVGFFTWQPVEGGTPIDQYELGLTYIVKRIQQKGGAVILCTPTVIEERGDGKNPMDAQLDKYADVVRKVARKTNSRLCDIRVAIVRYERENNKENKLKDVLTKDYVHMNDRGNRFIMENMVGFLK